MRFFLAIKHIKEIRKKKIMPAKIESVAKKNQVEIMTGEFNSYRNMFNNGVIQRQGEKESVKYHISEQSENLVTLHK